MEGHSLFHRTRIEWNQQDMTHSFSLVRGCMGLGSLSTPKVEIVGYCSLSNFINFFPVLTWVILNISLIKVCLSQFLRFDYYPSKLEYRSVKIEKILNIWVELIFLQNLESFSHHSFTTFLETAKRSTASIVVLVVGPVGAFFLLIIVLIYLRTKMQGQVKCKFHVCYFL